MRIAGMFEGDDEETTQEIPLEDVTEETVMPKKKSRKPKTKNKTKAAKTRSSSTRKTVKRSKPRNLIATTSRSGKKIHRAKAGGEGALAAKGVHLMVTRISGPLRDKLWAAARAKKLSMNAFLTGLYETAV